MGHNSDLEKALKNLKDIDDANSIEEIAEIQRAYNIVAEKAKWDVKSLLRDMYKDPSHFVFELLQNAEDTGATKISVKLEKDRFILIHNGRPFSLDDIKGICKAGMSGKTADKKGKFGIGFKSVYKITSTPLINSGRFSFRIIDFNVPISLEKNTDFIDLTEIILPFDLKESKEKIYDNVRQGLELLDDSSIMFLDFIEQINIEIDEDTRTITRQIDNLYFDDFNNISLSRLKTIGGNEDKYYLLVQSQILINDVKKTISIAYLDPKYDVEDSKINTHKLSVYFPTEQETYLRFKINAPFNTTHTREQVNYLDEHNKELLKKVIDLYQKSVLILKENNLLDIEFIYQFAISTSDSDNIFYQKFHQATKDVFNDNELLLTNDGEYVKASVALLCRDKKNFMDLLKEEDLKELFLGRCKWIDGTEIKTNRDDELRRFLTSVLEIIDVEFSVLNNRLTESFLAHKDDEWLKLFYEICITNIGNIQNNPKPIIRTSDDKMKSPYTRNKGKLELNVYLPSKIVKNHHKLIKNSFLSHEKSMTFFNELGIKEADTLELIKDNWIPALIEEQNPHYSAEIINEIFELINSSPSEKRNAIVNELKEIEFFPTFDKDTSLIKYKKPNDLYLRTQELDILFDGIDVPYVLEEVQMLYEQNSTFKNVTDELKINKDLKIVDIKYSHIPFLPKRVRDEIKLRFPNKELSPQKSQSFSDQEIEFMEEILNNIDEAKSHLLWKFVTNISDIMKYFAIYEFKFISSVVSETGKINPTFIDKLLKNSWIFIENQIFKPAEITVQLFSKKYGKANDFFSNLLNFKQPEDLSQLPIETREKIDIVRGRSKEDLTEALADLDIKKNRERLLQLKGEYLIGLFENDLEVVLSNSDKEKLLNIDYLLFNEYENQKIIIEILIENQIEIAVFNSVSERPINHISFFQEKLKKLLLQREQKWIASHFTTKKDEKIMSKKETFSEDLIKYKKYDFSELEELERLDIDFNVQEFYDSIEFLKFRDVINVVNINHEYNHNLKTLKEKIANENLSPDMSNLLLDNHSNRSLLFLGEIEELIKRYKVLISKPQKQPDIDLPNNLNVSYKESVTIGLDFSVDKKNPKTDFKGKIEKTTERREITGYKAEKIVYRHLIEKYERVEWDSENADVTINANGKAGLGYDMKFESNGTWYFIEVKGTKNHSNRLILNFTRNEIKFAQKNIKSYQIYICNGVENDNPIIVNIGNIFSYHNFIEKISDEKFIAVVNGYDVYIEIS